MEGFEFFIVFVGFFGLLFGDVCIWDDFFFIDESGSGFFKIKEVVFVVGEEDDDY